MKCPVCKTELVDGINCCQNCGFADIRTDFINVDEASFYIEEKVEPYIKLWKKGKTISTKSSKLQIDDNLIERDISLEKSLGIENIQYYGFTFLSGEALFITGELEIKNSLEDYVRFSCSLIDEDGDIIKAVDNNYYGDGMVTTRIRPNAFNHYPISFSIYLEKWELESIRRIVITPERAEKGWPMVQSEYHISEHTEFDRIVPNNLSVTPISVYALSVGQKLPKGYISVSSYLSLEISLIKFKYSVRKQEVFDDVAYFDINGSYTGEATQRYLLYAMAYNAENRLIAFRAEKTISCDFKGTDTFSYTLKVPNDEQISRIILRFANDPLQEM